MHPGSTFLSIGTGLLALSAHRRRMRLKRPMRPRSQAPRRAPAQDVAPPPLPTRRLKWRAGAIPALVLGAITLSPLEGAVIDNMSEFSNTGATIGTPTDFIFAQPFTFFNDVTFDQVTLRTGNSSAGTGFRVSLYDDNAGVPGSVLFFPLTGDPDPPTFATRTYSDPVNTFLSGGTQYWFLFEATDSSQFSMLGTTSSNVSGDGTMGEVISRPRSIATWGAPQGSRFRLTIEATPAVATPEPTSVGLMALGGGTLLLLRRRFLAR